MPPCAGARWRLPRGRCTSPRRRSASGCARWRSRPAGSCWCGRKPVQVTESGEAVLRLARQIDLLTADVAHELGDDPSAERVPTLPIAVNADSMATWVLPALTPLAGDVCVRPVPRGPGAHQRPAARRHGHGGGDRGGRPGARLHVHPARWDALPADGRARLRASAGSPPGPPPRRSPARRSSSSTARTTCSTATCTREPVPTSPLRCTTCPPRRTSSPPSPSAWAGAWCLIFRRGK